MSSIADQRPDAPHEGLLKVERRGGWVSGFRVQGMGFMVSGLGALNLDQFDLGQRVRSSCAI